MTTSPKQPDQKDSSDDKASEVDEQTKAMSRKIPRDPSVETDDQMQEAFTETRIGAVRGKDEDHPPQDEALANPFELNSPADTEDKMHEAMTERRKSVDK